MGNIRILRNISRKIDQELVRCRLQWPGSAFGVFDGLRRKRLSDEDLRPLLALGAFGSAKETTFTVKTPS
jgi:hypothetical protein